VDTLTNLYCTPTSSPVGVLLRPDPTLVLFLFRKTVRRIHSLVCKVKPAQRAPPVLVVNLMAGPVLSFAPESDVRHCLSNALGILFRIWGDFSGFCVTFFF